MKATTSHRLSVTVDQPESRIVSSRRLMGPNLFARREGGVLEIAAVEPERRTLLRAWRGIMDELLVRLRIVAEAIVVREHPGGAQLFLSAPLDALLAATEINEAAWEGAERLVDAGHQPDTGTMAARLRVHLQHEHRPHLLALTHEADARRLSVSIDDDGLSFGSGEGTLVLGAGAWPTVESIDWKAIHDIPVALVTGSNGKTTTTRLVAAMLAASGHEVGLTSTDGVFIGNTGIAHGDYSGPAGARLVLRDRRVTAAVLETARGGLLRRGLATTRATVAVVTRVAPDHFGEYGIFDLATLGEVKLIVARAIGPDGRVVLNADDPTLVALAHTVEAPMVWCSLAGDNPLVTAHVAQGGAACVLDDGEVTMLNAGTRRSFGLAADMPITLAGRARYNIANVLAASACALAMGVSPDTIRQTLGSFGARPEDNPGRLVFLERAGVRIVVDFVHNPDGWRALYGALRDVPAARRLVVLGQAGDRDDAALRELAEAAWEGRPALVVLKEMTKYLRGREPGVITSILGAAFRQLGLGEDGLVVCSDEVEAVLFALKAARPGDLLILAVHSDYDGVMQLLLAEGARPLYLTK
ncbi:MAG: Mur ligase family protein [Gemmatimonadaceae bacterium]|nr:Mur ligase family protein [Gemmatimonadaceae bacterium]